MLTDKEDTSLLEDAVRGWEWFATSSMINDQLLVNDGLNDDCENNGGTVWTYNCGVVLSGLGYLYLANGNETYLAMALDMAEATLAQMTTTDGILTESCCMDTDDCTCNHDGKVRLRLRLLCYEKECAPL